MKKIKLLRIALPTPTRYAFDYLPPDNIDLEKLEPGVRVLVPFRKQLAVGIFLGLSNDSNIALQKLKTIIEIIDQQPILPKTLLKLLSWASDYYQYPLGEALLGILPTALRHGQPAKLPQKYHWQLTPHGLAGDISLLKRSAKQVALFELLKQHPLGLSTAEILAAGFTRLIIKALQERDWIHECPIEDLSVPETKNDFLPLLNQYQQHAVDAILSNMEFHTYLLQGITGSGKTEVYLRVIEGILTRGQQALVLVPEIGLTPQTISRFQARFNVPILALHSALTDTERLHAWLAAQQEKARIIIGTRSALFIPLARPGIIIIDEEHDPSFKQQSGFRYSARDLAIVRGRLDNIPVILGSATPSLESFYNAQHKRFTCLTLPERAGNAHPPKFHIVDLRKQPLFQGLSRISLQAIEQHLFQKNQVLLFLNRRGYAPVLLCHQCGWSAHCPRCDAHLTIHHDPYQLVCHHCATIQIPMSHCQKCKHTPLLEIGLGTERLEQILIQHFPDTVITRIDRDTTRRKGQLASKLEDIHSGQSQILIGTQMLAKGHHFPHVTLVIIVDADSGLYCTDFRGTERLAQLIIQVAGRAGRADKPGEVIIQTHQPDHPLLLQLTNQGYSQFATSLLEERKQAKWPPFYCLALLRAEAVYNDLPLSFLNQAKKCAPTSSPQIQLFGPVPAIMERKAGKYRAQLLIQSTSRSYLQQWLNEFITKVETLKLANKVRWSIDVDPLDLL